MDAADSEIDQRCAREQTKKKARTCMLRKNALRGFVGHLVAPLPVGSRSFMDAPSVTGVDVNQFVRSRSCCYVGVGDASRRAR